METIFFGGGCFWCVEAPFLLLKGVQKVTPGYMGGRYKSPTYESVCSGQTGHAEVVKVEFDSKAISHASLFDVFFTIHDPTTLNKQGADEGTQYRSIVFIEEFNYDNAKVLLSEKNSSSIFENPIVTEIIPVGPKDWSGESGDIKKTFWSAENYHQNYFNNNKNNAYCSAVISPKITKIRQSYFELVKG